MNRSVDTSLLQAVIQICISSELATSLRGRTLQYEEFPLSFREYCSFVGVDTNYYVPEYRARIVNAFKVYLHQGGFPEVSLAIPMLKDRILQEYFFVMLYKVCGKI